MLISSSNISKNSIVMYSQELQDIQSNNNHKIKACSTKNKIKTLIRKISISKLRLRNYQKSRSLKLKGMKCQIYRISCKITMRILKKNISNKNKIMKRILRIIFNNQNKKKGNLKSNINMSKNSPYLFFIINI